MSKLKNKDALKRFREKCNLIFESTSFEAFESKETQDNRINRARNDYAFFVEYYFPHYATAKCAEFHIKTANRIKNNPQCREILMWARGHAKSTHSNILIPLWLKIQKENGFRVMVLVSKNQDNAITLISDLQAELEHNRRYIHDFGPQLKYGSWEEGKFVTKSDHAFFALGRGQSPRGLRYRQFRPDYIIVDDLDDDELCRNPSRVEKMHDWVLEALFGSMDMGKGRFIVAGNLISRTSVLAKLSENKSFHVSKVNALDKSGNPSWKEKYNIEDIKKTIETLGYRKSQKELFNNPIVEGAVFKQEWLIWTKPLAFSKYQRLIGYIDPSLKNTKTSDFKAIMIVGSTGKELHILKAFVRKCSVNEMVRWVYDFASKLPENVICEFYMEASFAQDLILDEFDKEGHNRGMLLPIRKDSRHKPDKHARIEAISPLFERGLIKLNILEKNNPDMNTFVEQLLSFEKGSSTHDDGPDALEGAVYLLSRNMRRSETVYFIAKRQTRHF